MLQWLLKHYQMIFTNVSCMVISWWPSHCRYLTFEIQISSPSDGMHRLQEQTCALLAEHQSLLQVVWWYSLSHHLSLSIPRSTQALWALRASIATHFASPACVFGLHGHLPNPSMPAKTQKDQIISVYDHGNSLTSIFSSLPLALNLLGAEVVSVALSSFVLWYNSQVQCDASNK